MLVCSAEVYQKLIHELLFDHPDPLIPVHAVRKWVARLRQHASLETIRAIVPSVRTGAASHVSFNRPYLRTTVFVAGGLCTRSSFFCGMFSALRILQVNYRG
jgi:hypothetical protein